MNNIVDIAREQAFKAHEDVSHLYDGEPYKVHLIMAQVIAMAFAHLIPKEDILDVIGGVLHHDTIEDTNLTYEDIRNATNVRIAKLAKAVTNKEGATRQERANDEYYEGIRNTKYATFVKLCDRIANVQASLESNRRLFDMYKKEHQHFKEMLYTEEYNEMWILLDFLMK